MVARPVFFCSEPLRSSWPSSAESPSPGSTNAGPSCLSRSLRFLMTKSGCPSLRKTTSPVLDLRSGEACRCRSGRRRHAGQARQQISRAVESKQEGRPAQRDLFRHGILAQEVPPGHVGGQRSNFQPRLGAGGFGAISSRCGSDAIINLTFGADVYFLDAHGAAINRFQVLRDLWSYPTGTQGITDENTRSHQDKRDAQQRNKHEAFHLALPLSHHLNGQRTCSVDARFGPSVCLIFWKRLPHG